MGTSQLTKDNVAKSYRQLLSIVTTTLAVCRFPLSSPSCTDARCHVMQRALIEGVSFSRLESSQSPPSLALRAELNPHSIVDGTLSRRSLSSIRILRLVIPKRTVISLSTTKKRLRSNDQISSIERMQASSSRVCCSKVSRTGCFISAQRRADGVLTITAFFGGSTEDYASPVLTHTYYKNWRFFEGDEASTESGKSVVASMQG